jgi:Skp family chaperone for outer membrane proteins
MKLRVNAAAAAILAASLVVSYAGASGQAPQAKKHHATRREKTPPPPSVEDQIEALRNQLQTQIDTLKSDLTAKDAELQQAQQAAAEAQAAAQKAQAAADQQQQAVTDNAAAVGTLNSTVKDLQGNQASLATTISDETSTIKKAIESPDALHYKGITLSPAGSFLAGETVWRQGATGGDINTPLTNIPLQNSDAAQLSEFFGSGRQSRLAVKAVGKLDNMTLTGYYEADWLSAGVTSNNNQSNSYTMRQRQLWADAKLANGWDFSAGQGWSLAAETTSGLTRGTEPLPSTIDAQYSAGFVWSRQYSFRVSKDIGKKVFVGFSAENAETLNPTADNLPTNLDYIFGTTGVGGGLYDNQSNYSFNVSPDLIAKVAVEPGWGHWEAFGVGRFFRDRIYPSSGTPYNQTEPGGGIGGGFRGPLANKKITIGLKGLYGIGVGRYGSSTIADITVRPDGTLEPLKAFSALSTVEASPTKRLSLYFNYGEDYVYRNWVLDTNESDSSYNKEVGYGTPTTNMSGCETETYSVDAGGAKSTKGYNAPANCGGDIKDIQEFTAGYWYNIYNGAKGRLRQGFTYENASRYIWSGNGGETNPGGGAHGTDNMIFTSLRYYLP